VARPNYIRVLAILTSMITAALVTLVVASGLASAQTPPPGTTLDASYWNDYAPYGQSVGAGMDAAEAQTFTAVYSGEVTDVELSLGYSTPHITPITVQLSELNRSGAPGNVLASTTIPGSVLPPVSGSPPPRVTAHFDNPVRIKAGKRYALVLSVPAGDTSDTLWLSSADTNPYTGGHHCVKATSTGLAWNCSQADYYDQLFTIFVQLDPGVNAAPRVANVTPSLGGSWSVDAWSSPTATFSEEMNPSTLTVETVKLFEWNSQSKKWQQLTDVGVSCDSPCRTATLDPYPSDDSKPLTWGTKYQVTVTTGAKDLSGKRLDQKPGARGRQSMSWTFVT
jgi:hypothetical protein